MVAEIIISTNVKELNKIFDYNIPSHLNNKVKLGSRVYIPFGNKKSLEEGFVVNIKEKSEYKIKNISDVEDYEYVNESNIELAKWMANNYFCNISDCINLMLPPGTSNKEQKKRVKEKNCTYVYSKISKQELEMEILNKQIKSHKQIQIMRMLTDNGEFLKSDLINITNTSLEILKTLHKKNYVEFVEKQIERNPFKDKLINKTTKLLLTNEQKKAFEKISDSIDDYMNSEFLLHGITGSRKNRSIFTINRKNIKKWKNKYCSCTRNIFNSSNS